MWSCFQSHWSHIREGKPWLAHFAKQEQGTDIALVVCEKKLLINSDFPVVWNDIGSRRTPFTQDSKPLSFSNHICHWGFLWENHPQHLMTRKANMAKAAGGGAWGNEQLSHACRPGIYGHTQGRSGYTWRLHFSPTWRQFQPCNWSNIRASRLPWQGWPFKPRLYTLSQCSYKTLGLHTVPIFSWIAPQNFSAVAPLTETKGWKLFCRPCLFQKIEVLVCISLSTGGQHWLKKKNHNKLCLGITERWVSWQRHKQRKSARNAQDAAPRTEKIKCHCNAKEVSQTATEISDHGMEMTGQKKVCRNILSLETLSFMEAFKCALLIWSSVVLNKTRHHIDSILDI